MSLQRVNEVEYIRDFVRRIAPGQRLLVAGSTFRQYDSGALFIGTPFMGPDLVLEGIIGASYEYGYTLDHQNDTIDFFRLAEPLSGHDGRRTYVSPDRRHHYVKVDIYYHPKES